MHFIYLNDAIISVKNGAKTVVATDVSVWRNVLKAIEKAEGQ